METIEYDGKIYNLEWNEGIIPAGLNVTQVSGYVFDDEGRLLITKVGKHWTMPGGHPEKGETYLDVLHREVFEETCIRVKNPIMIGYVKVTPKHDEPIHYQIRYKALVDKVEEFDNKFEASERKFVKIDEIKDYITWFDSEIFQYQLKAALNA